MLHKVYIIGGLNWISFTNSIAYGHVTGIISSLQKNDESLDFSEGQISLIASSLVWVTIIGYWSASIVTDKIGRRWSFILFSIPATLNWIILYHAREMYQFMLSRVIAGVSFGGLIVLCLFVTAEYTSPLTRAFFLNMIMTVAPALGTSVGHILGVFFHWRTVTLIAIFPTALGILLPYFWIESPHWLASKGKFQECKKAFRQLHGSKTSTERELELLIKMETCKLKEASEMNRKTTLKRLIRAFKMRYFWDLLLLSIFMHGYFTAAGKLIFSVLSTVILEEITGTSDVFLFTLLVDGFIIIGSCLSCVLITKTSIRILLFSTGYLAVSILVVFSACFYFKNNLEYFNWINVSLLALYFIILNAGPYPLLEVLYSEMFPLELKLYIFSISSIILMSALSLTITLLPYTVRSIGYHGLFLLNATIMAVSLTYIWWKLPETKGRTLQEIEMYFKTKNFDVEEVLNKEHLNSLI